MNNVMGTKPLLKQETNPTYMREIAEEIDRQRDHYSNKFSTIDEKRAKFSDVTKNYFPEKNKKNIQEREL